jgi:recombination protein RecA
MALSKEMSSVLKSIAKSTPKIVKNPNESGRIKRVILDSPQMNYILGGGFAIGRIYNIYGPFSGGKSSICNYIAGQLQQKMPEGHRIVAFADFERSFDVAYATENGLDCTPVQDGGNFLFLQPDSIEEFIDTSMELIKTGEIACIILDSEAAAPTKMAMMSEAGKACVAPNTIVEFFIED